MAAEATAPLGSSFHVVRTLTPARKIRPAVAGSPRSGKIDLKAIPASVTSLLATLLGGSSPLPVLCGHAGASCSGRGGSAKFTAVGDGVADDTAAFQHALNVGDVYVPSGVYRIRGAIKVPSYRTIQCQPGAVLKADGELDSGRAIFDFAGTNQGTVIGCIFSTRSRFRKVNSPSHAIYVRSGNNNLFIGNAFTGEYSGASIELAAGASGNIVILNDFEVAAREAVRLKSVANTLVELNRFTGISVSEEPQQHTLKSHNHVRNNHFVISVARHAVIGDTRRDDLVSRDSGEAAKEAPEVSSFRAVPAGRVQGVSVESKKLSQHVQALLSLIRPAAVSMPAPSEYHTVSPGMHMFGGKPWMVAGDGIGDDTAAIQSAVNEGDIRIEPGVYAIRGTIKVPDYRNVVCEVGAVLFNPKTRSGMNVVLEWDGTGHGSLIGCTLRGTNTRPPRYDEHNEYNYLVEIATGHASSQDILILGNTFSSAWSDELLVYSADREHQSSDIAVIANSFENCGLNGYHENGGVHNRFAFNRAVDCRVTAEVDRGTLQNVNTYIDHNVATYRDGLAPFTGRCIGICPAEQGTPQVIDGGSGVYGGWSANNHVYNNLLDSSGVQAGVWLWSGNGSLATYMNNRCINGAIDKGGGHC